MLDRPYWTAVSAIRYLRDRRLPYHSTADLQNLQDRRARSIAAHAYATVPFYRQAMTERRLRPADIRSARDLEQLPLIGGADLAAAPERFLSTAFARRPKLELTTSGSTGHAKRIWWSPGAVFSTRAAMRRGRDVVARLIGRPAAPTGYRELRILRPGGTASLFEAFYRRHSWFPGRLRGELATVSIAAPFAENLAAINAFRPEVLLGFGSYLGALLRWAQTSGEEIWRPKVVVYGGDTMPDADRRLIETELGVPVVATYQSCEAWRIAFQCERRDGYHLDVDQVAVRIVDPNGATLPPGERGRVVLSNLTNRATVLLNYDLGDLATLSPESCACGRTLPLLARLDGRADDFVLLPDGSPLHESVVLSRLYSVPGVGMVQLTQRARRGFRLLVVPARHAEPTAICRGLEAALRELLGDDPPLDLTIQPVDAVPREASGKFKSIRREIHSAIP